MQNIPHVNQPSLQMIEKMTNIHEFDFSQLQVLLAPVEQCACVNYQLSKLFNKYLYECVHFILV